MFVRGGEVLVLTVTTGCVGDEGENVAERGAVLHLQAAPWCSQVKDGALAGGFPSVRML